jgi:predicted phage terminase large subunit-like protein
MIKRTWIQRYDELPARTSSTLVLQSYDTALKFGADNDFAVCTTWYLVDGKYYLADILRGRFDYPTLTARAFEHAQIHRPSLILVEDSGLGPALVSDLNGRGSSARAVKVELDKRTRMAIQATKFENGKIYLPVRSPWLEDLESELFAFPASPHDDQIDSISQALAHQIQGPLWNANSLKGLDRFFEIVALDQAIGRLTGRPW